MGLHKSTARQMIAVLILAVLWNRPLKDYNRKYPFLWIFVRNIRIQWRAVVIT